MALVLMAPSLSWPVFLFACLATVIGLAVLASRGGKRIAAAVVCACLLAGPFVVTAHAAVVAVDCTIYWWIVECWFR